MDNELKKTLRDELRAFVSRGLRGEALPQETAILPEILRIYLELCFS